MLEIDTQAIGKAIQESFTMIWEAVGKSLVETIINLFIQVTTSAPVGDIILALMLLSLVIGALGLVLHWAVKQVNKSY